jgi:transposase
MRRRGEYVERSFAHLYDTGGMRRTHLRGHENILKRLLVHAGAFNLGLLMRKAFGRGTPRGLQGRQFDAGALEITLGTLLDGLWTLRKRFRRLLQPLPPALPTYWTVVPAC